MPSLELAAGQVLTAAHTNTYWMRQVIASGLSSARPTGYEGRAVYDTDTDALMIYASATTGWKPPWNLPWGEQGRSVLTANGSAISGTPADTGLSVAFTATAGRRYVAKWNLDFVQSVVTDLTTMFLDVGGAGVARDLATCRPSDGYGTSAMSFELTGLPAGTNTVKVRASCTGGGNIIPAASSSFPAQLTIHDAGPSSAPA